MKLYITVFLLCVLQSIVAQEICDNAIDDDGDGLIDLNDLVDCACTGGVGGIPNSLMPNSSFESYTGCPSTYAEVNLATGWQQATYATSDYFNQCGSFTSLIPGVDDPSPYPDGNGCMGFHDDSYNNAWPFKEYIGTCLLSPLLAGINYTLQLKIYTSQYDNGYMICNSTNLDLTIFGTSNCANLPLGGTGTECPASISSDWNAVASTQVDFVASTWQTITINFTPSADIAALCIGPSCVYSTPNCTQPEPSVNYYYVDQLILNESSNFNSITISQTGLYCGNNIVLEAQLASPPVSPLYQWYKEGIAILGATNPTYNVPGGLSGLGDFQVRVMDGTDCFLSAVYSVVEENLEFTTSVTNPLCQGENSGAIEITPTNGTAPYQYYVNNVLLGSNTASNLVAGTYTVLLEDAVGCSSTSQVIITEPSVVTVQSNNVCLPLGNGNLTATASGGTGPYSFLWNGIAGVSPYVLNITQDAVYTVQAIDANGCLSDIEQVQAGYVPMIDFMADLYKTCPDQELNFTLLIDGQPMYTNVQTAEWLFGEGGSSFAPNPVKYTYQEPGEYDVSVDVTFTNGCITPLEKLDLIEIYEFPKAQFVSNIQPTTILNPEIHFQNKSLNHTSSIWSLEGLPFAASEHAQYLFDDQNGGKYQVCLEVMSTHGCKDLTCQEIVIEDDLFLYIPNSFTPEENGLNDVFSVKYSGSKIEYFELDIYNRWGQVVKSFSSINDSWDGTYSGTLAPMGVYSYKIKGKYAGHRDFSQHGIVNLIR